jgi:hypothetical protein
MVMDVMHNQALGRILTMPGFYASAKSWSQLVLKYATYMYLCLKLPMFAEKFPCEDRLNIIRVIARIIEMRFQAYYCNSHESRVMRTHT